MPNKESDMKHSIAAIISLLFLFTCTAASADEAENKEKESKCMCPAGRLSRGILSWDKGEFSAALHGRMQGWGGWVGNESLLTNGDRMQKPGFRLRRARLGVDGRFFKDFSFNLEIDLYDQERTGGPLYSAWLDWTPTHFIGATLGVDKFLFMKSEMMSSAYLPHLDRPLGTFALAPSNVLGLVLHSEPWKEHLSIQIGLFNGLRRRGNFFQGYEGVGVTLGNRFEGLALAARLDLEPLGKLGKGLADVCKKKDFRLGLGVGGFFNGNDWLGAPESGAIVTDGISAYLHLKVAGFHFFGEYAKEWTFPRPEPTTPSDETIDKERHVANVSLGYVILKNTLGLALRAEYIDDYLTETEGPDGTTVKEGSQFLISGTVNYYIVADFLKAQVEYTHRMELDDGERSNDSVIAGVQLMF